MDQEFHRIKRLPPYAFAEVNAMKARSAYYQRRFAVEIDPEAEFIVTLDSKERLAAAGWEVPSSPAFVRIGLVENRHRTRQAVRNIKTFLGNYDKVLEDSEKQRASSGS